ncbi:hypothetical protein BGX38DRAFT_575061 [Terfezia claveryi]|nr:hypothetical protein BGX38DRAFT_575061 [Terfezia claveryi]
MFSHCHSEDTYICAYLGKDSHPLGFVSSVPLTLSGNACAVDQVPNNWIYNLGSNPNPNPTLRQPHIVGQNRFDAHQITITITIILTLVLGCMVMRGPGYIGGNGIAGFQNLTATRAYRHLVSRTSLPSVGSGRSQPVLYQLQNVIHEGEETPILPGPFMSTPRSTACPR